MQLGKMASQAHISRALLVSFIPRSFPKHTGSMDKCNPFLISPSQTDRRTSKIADQTSPVFLNGEGEQYCGAVRCNSSCCLERPKKAHCAVVLPEPRLEHLPSS